MIAAPGFLTGIVLGGWMAASSVAALPPCIDASCAGKTIIASEQQPGKRNASWDKLNR